MFAKAILAAFLCAGAGTLLLAQAETETTSVASSGFGGAQALDEPVRLPDVRAALEEDTRIVLHNRLLDETCELTRSGRRVVAEPGCADAFAGAHRVRNMRVHERRVTLTDELGSLVVDFAWNAETGMASLPSPGAREMGALAILPTGR